MISFFRLIRYKNLLMILVTMILTKYALIDAFIEQRYVSNFQFLILVSSVILIAAGGYIINDIFDIKADEINRPTKVIIDNFIHIKTAWFLFYVLTICGLIVGFYASQHHNYLCYNCIFIVSSLGLVLYSVYLKKIVFIGNFVISLFCSLPIILIFWFENPINPLDIGLEVSLYVSILFYSVFAFLTTLIREIIKDIEDVDGDLKLNAKTLPIVLGRKRAKNIAVIISIVLLFCLIQIATNYLYPIPVLLGYTYIFILMPLAYFTYQLWQATTKKQFHFLSNFMKLIMLFGILSMILFQFN